MKSDDHYLMPHKASDRLPDKANRYLCHIISTGEWSDKYFNIEEKSFWKQSWTAEDKAEYYDNKDVIWYEKIYKEEIMHRDSMVREMRMRYAGVIGLLCECSVYVTEEEREPIIRAVEDWCSETGWKMKRIMDRIDVQPGIEIFDKDDVSDDSEEYNGRIEKSM